MRRHFAAFAGAVAATAEPAPTAVPHVPQQGNGLGNTIGGAQTPVTQGFARPVPHVPLVPHENERSRDALAIEREERAACLEFNEGLSQVDAEATAGKCPPLGSVSSTIESARTIGAHAPAIEVPYAEYDRQADALIADAITAGSDPGSLRRKKMKGHVTERGEDWIFVRGRG